MSSSRPERVAIKHVLLQWNGQNIINTTWKEGDYDIDVFVQDCSNSSALAMKLLQSCTETSIWN